MRRSRQRRDSDKIIRRMKQSSYSLLASMLLCLVLTACKEDEKEERIQCLTITETTGFGPERVTTVQQFNYTDGKLMQHVTTQTYTDLKEKAKYTHTVSTSIAYEPGKAIITDDTGTVSTYQLNDYGYAVSCTRNEPGGSVRTYLFNYSSTDYGLLARIKESINGSPYSEISITATSDGTMSITEELNNYQGKFTATVNDRYPGISNAKSGLPWLHLTERYPLSLHADAYYAHILGEPLSTLPGYLTIEGSDETSTYTYKSDTYGYVTSCTIRTGVSNSSWSRVVEYSYILE